MQMGYSDVLWPFLNIALTGLSHEMDSAFENMHGQLLA